MLKPFILLLLFSNLLIAQENILTLAKDSDIILLNHSKIAENNIKSISFIEKIDSLLFKNYPLPSSNIKYIKHKTLYNTQGLSDNYEWSFADSKELIENETEKSSGSFFIANEYKFEYNNSKIINEYISDASPLLKISYSYFKDSISQETTIFSTSSSSQVVKKSFNNNNNKLTYSHSGIKQHFFPSMQIISLGKVESNNIYVNKLPFLSFFDKKFDNNRFLVEIRPGLWILFELID